MKNKHIIKSNTENKDLAEEIGDLYYDSLADFLKELSKKLEKDSIADMNRGRDKLANNLNQASKKILDASKEINEAWDICEPFMKK